MTFDISSYCSNDWMYLDGVQDAILIPGDAGGDDAVTYPVKVCWVGEKKTPAHDGGRFPTSPRSWGVTLWKANSPTSPDPETDEGLDIDGTVWRISGVGKPIYGQWHLTVVEGKVNR